MGAAYTAGMNAAVRWIVVVVFVAAAMFGVASFFGSGAATPGESELEAPFEDGDGNDDEARLAGAREPGVDAAAGVRSGEATPSPRRGRASNAERALRVRVLLPGAGGGTPMPCPGAVVAALSHEDCLRLRAQAGSQKLPLASIVEGFGARVRAGADGVAHLAPLGRPSSSTSSTSSTSNPLVVVAAWLDGDFACREFLRSEFMRDEPVDVVLARDMSLVLRVLGPDGQAVPRFPLRFYRLSAAPWARELPHRVSTDAEGRLVVAHWQTIMESPTMGCVVFPDLVYRDPPPFLSFRHEDLDKEHVLRVGATGSLAFVVKARDGRAIVSPGSVTIEAQNAPLEIDGCKIPVLRPSAKLEAGRARFERAGLGLRVRPRVRLGKLYRTEAGEEFVGPVRGGQLVEHEIRLNDGVRVRGKIAFAGAADPEAEQRLSLTVSAPNTRARGMWIRCDAGGSFSTLLPYCGAGSYRVVLEAPAKSARDGSVTKLQALRFLAVAGAAADLDLGLVKLEAPHRCFVASSATPTAKSWKASVSRSSRSARSRGAHSGRIRTF